MSTSTSTRHGEPRDRRRAARACTLAFVALLTFIALSQARAYLRLDFDPADPRYNEGFKPDFCDFWLAGKTLLAGDNFYDVGRRWYVYPPMLALCCAPLAMLPIGVAGAAWACVNTAIIGACSWLGVREFARRFAVPTWAPALAAVVPAATLLATALMADKSRAVVRLGQTDGLVALACVLSLRWLGRKPVWSGLALAFAANIKYQSLIFLPYLLVRRRWTEAASAALGAAGIAMSSALVFGWERNLEYVGRAVSSLARLLGTRPPPDATLQPIHPLAWERSVSFPSVFARLAEAHAWPAWTVIVGVGGLAAVVFVVTWCVFRANGINLFAGRGGRGDDLTPRLRAVVGVEWVGLIVALTVFSPQTSARHMFIVLVPVAAAAVIILCGPRGLPRAATVVGAVVLVLGMVLPPGGESFVHAVEWWRWVGGASWCVLAMWCGTSFAGTAWAAGLRANSTDDRGKLSKEVLTGSGSSEKV